MRVLARRVPAPTVAGERCAGRGLGAGAVAHFAPAVAAGADAVLAASVFHFGTLRISEVKDTLRAVGHPVR